MLAAFWRWLASCWRLMASCLRWPEFCYCFCSRSRSCHSSCRFCRNSSWCLSSRVCASLWARTGSRARDCRGLPVNLPGASPPVPYLFHLPLLFQYLSRFAAGSGQRHTDHRSAYRPSQPAPPVHFPCRHPSLPWPQQCQARLLSRRQDYRRQPRGPRPHQTQYAYDNQVNRHNNAQQAGLNQYQDPGD